MREAVDNQVAGLETHIVVAGDLRRFVTDTVTMSKSVSRFAIAETSSRSTRGV